MATTNRTTPLYVGVIIAALVITSMVCVLRVMSRRRIRRASKMTILPAVQYAPPHLPGGMMYAPPPPANNAPMPMPMPMLPSTPMQAYQPPPGPPPPRLLNRPHSPPHPTPPALSPRTHHQTSSSGGPSAPPFPQPYHFPPPTTPPQSQRAPAIAPPGLPLEAAQSSHAQSPPTPPTPNRISVHMPNPTGRPPPAPAPPPTSLMDRMREVQTLMLEIHRLENEPVGRGGETDARARIEELRRRVDALSDREDDEEGRGVPDRGSVAVPVEGRAATSTPLGPPPAYAVDAP